MKRLTVDLADYARREYGATLDQVAALEAATERRRLLLERRGRLVTLSAAQLRDLSGHAAPEIARPRASPPLTKSRLETTSRPRDGGRRAQGRPRASRSSSS
jgi:hypothetical protein